MKKTNTVFQFKITLNQSTPRIWRRILVPKSYSFFAFHVAIQEAMEWMDSHLHSFKILPKGARDPIYINFPDPENDWPGMESLDERREKIADYFPRMVKQCLYSYDFGDGWDHTVLFEREVRAETYKRYPACTAGGSACPPENCGGVGGYRDLQKILKDPNHSEHKEMLHWLRLKKASEFDPAKFNPEEVIFSNPAERLKEYERGFGVGPISR